MSEIPPPSDAESPDPAGEVETEPEANAAATAETEPAETESAEATSAPVDWTVVTVVALFCLSILLAAFEVFKIGDVPAHVLVNHLPVVLVPVLAVASVIIIWRDAWRQRFALALAVVALVATAATTLAVATGEALRDHLFRGAAGFGRALSSDQRLIERHADAGDALRIIVFIFAGVLIAHFVTERLSKGESPYVVVAFKIATTVFAVLALFTVIYTGHLGVEATWKDRVNTSNTRSGQLPNSQMPFGNQRQEREFPNQQRRFGQSTPRNSSSTTTSTTVKPSTL